MESGKNRFRGIRIGKAVEAHLRIAALGALMLATTAANAVVINGSDLTGGNLTPGDGDVLSGAFINVGNFSIGAGTTVYVMPGVALSIAANTIVIDGTLNADGAGFAGGAGGIGGSSTAPGGVAGSGPGAGAGGGPGLCVHGGGGAGGGYGGNGGNGGYWFSSPTAAGGSSYGSTLATNVQMGSGGGGGGAACDYIGGVSGAGGGAVDLSALADLILNGSITADGLDGANGDTFSGGGGGGSGGGILLSGILTLDGTLSATGADGGAQTGGLSASGGGGGGGRIKLAGTLNSVGAGFSTDVSGGSSGVNRGGSAQPPGSGLAGDCCRGGNNCPGTRRARPVAQQPRPRGSGFCPASQASHLTAPLNR